MDTVELLKIFSDPATIESLSTGKRILAGLYTTILGMGITFVALIILQCITSVFSRVMAGRAPKKPADDVQPAAQEVAPPSIPASSAKTDDAEIVAAITAALALSLGTSSSNIVIKNIRRVNNTTPAWARVGLTEQMANHT